MKHARPLLLAASTLALLISACSTPADLQAPLEPQFGTVDDDFASSVDLGSNGLVHVGAARNYYRETTEQTFSNELHVRQYDGTGTLRWKKTLETYACTGRAEDCDDYAEVTDVQTDGQGNVYALTTLSFFNFEDLPGSHNTLYKLDRTGVPLNEFHVGKASSDNISLWVDGAGNIYIARTDNSDSGGGAYGDFLTKYTSGGRFVWETQPNLGTLRDVVVSSSGNVYVVGENGTNRYNSSGSLTWTKPGGGDEVVISGTNLFVRNGNTVRKLNSSGTQLWSRTQGGLNSFFVSGMAGDTSGNVHVSGTYAVSAENQNAFTRKISSSGATVWTKTYGDTTFDDAHAIDTVSGSDIYVVGSSTGKVNGTNNGGSDAYLLRLNAQGQKVWSR